MSAAPLPATEQERLAALHELRLLDSAPEEAFDALTRMASTLLDVPIAVVSLVDATRQWFKSRTGVDATETSRESAFCAHAILGDTPFIIPDACADDRFADNPLVTGGPKIRAYAGVPLVTTDGHAIGTLCAIDSRPREFNDRELALLGDLARIAQREIRYREATLRARQLADDSVQAVLQSERLYQVTFDRAAIGIATVALDGRWLRMNPRLCSILDRSSQELAALTFQDVTHPDDLSTDLGQVQRLLDREIDHYTLEKRYLRPDGSIVWGNLTVTLALDEQGQPQHFVATVEDISARRATEDALHALRLELERRVAERTAELEDLYRNAPCGYYSLDADGRFVQINEMALGLFGAARETLIGRRGARDFLSEEGRKRFAEVYPRFMVEGSFGPEEFDLLGADGQQRRIRVTATALRDAEGRFLRSRTAVFDVTELHLARETLRAVNRQQHLMLDNELVSIVKLKNRRIVWANRAFEQLLGYGTGELEGLSTRRLHADDESFTRAGQAAYRAVTAGGSYRGQSEFITKDGRRIWVDLSGAQLAPETGESLWMMLDITAMKVYQAEVEALAYHDALTGLPNRMLLMDRLTQALAAATRSGQHVAVCFADLNGFKAVNDAHGHEAGDDLLRAVADRLGSVVRAHDTVARLGGDEFVLVLTQLAGAEECEAILRRAEAAIAAPVVMPDGSLAQVSASFGIAHGPVAEDDAGALLARADAAMYVQKRRSKAVITQPALLTD